MKNYIYYVFLVCMSIFMAGLINIDVNQEINNEVFTESSEIINFNVYDGEVCFLHLCTDSKGEVTDAACLGSDDGGLSCTGCTPPCPDSDLGQV
jgi:hypothetical protein